MAKMGRPRTFKSGEEFLNKINEYVEYCEEQEKFVNVAGFCRFCGIHRQRYWEQKEYYPDAFLMAEEILEDETLNNRKNPVPIVMMYLKNKFDYKDKIETENVNTNVNTNKNYDLSNLSTEQIKELLDNES